MPAFLLGLGIAWLAVAVGTVLGLNRATRHAVDDPTDSPAERIPWDRDLADLLHESVD